MYATVLIRPDPTRPPNIPWHLSRRYGADFAVPAHPPAVASRSTVPAPALVVEAKGIRVEASDGGLDRLLRFLGQAIRDVAPYALGAYVVHRVCEALEESTKS